MRKRDTDGLIRGHWIEQGRRHYRKEVFDDVAFATYLSDFLQNMAEISNQKKKDEMHQGGLLQRNAKMIKR